MFAVEARHMCVQRQDVAWERCPAHSSRNSSDSAVPSGGASASSGVGASASAMVGVEQCGEKLLLRCPPPPYKVRFEDFSAFSDNCFQSVSL